MTAAYSLVHPEYLENAVLLDPWGMPARPENYQPASYMLTILNMQYAVCILPRRSDKHTNVKTKGRTK